MTDPPAGISFMGKDWDSDKGGGKEWTNWLSQVMRECYRVMKPGAHGLVWALPRISHRTAMAIEWSGLEVRDVVTHLFGSGFPKSLDISKSIDKKAGAKREIVGRSPFDSRRVNPNGGKTTGAFEHNGASVTAPATPEAHQWSGWGTALKPAAEFWFLVRKPLEGSVSQNVLKWGTGGLNIDASRIGAEGGTCRDSQVNQKTMAGWTTGHGIEQLNKGRFPANLVLSHDPECVELAPGKRLEGKRTTQDFTGKTRERANAITYPNETPAKFKCTETCAVRMLDEQSGQFAGQIGMKVESKFAFSSGVVRDYKQSFTPGMKDFGGASRFFYCAKPSRHERDFGVEGVERYINNVGRDSQKILEANNNHPTVKPYRLMRYFIRMVTPPGGTVLDCFMGSGTTGTVAVACGFRFVGIEQDAKFLEIARSRISSVKLTRDVPEQEIDGGLGPKE